MQSSFVQMINWNFGQASSLTIVVMLCYVLKAIQFLKRIRQTDWQTDIVMRKWTHSAMAHYFAEFHWIIHGKLYHFILMYQTSTQTYLNFLFAINHFQSISFIYTYIFIYGRNLQFCLFLLYEAQYISLSSLFLLVQWSIKQSVWLFLVVFQVIDLFVYDSVTFRTYLSKGWDNTRLHD